MADPQDPVAAVGPSTDADANGPGADAQAAPAQSFNAVAVVAAINEQLNALEGQLYVNRDDSDLRGFYLMLHLERCVLEFEDAFEPPDAWQVAVSVSDLISPDKRSKLDNRFFDRIDEGLGEPGEAPLSIDIDPEVLGQESLGSADDLGELQCYFSVTFEGFNSQTNDPVRLNAPLSPEALEAAWEARLVPIPEEPEPAEGAPPTA